MGYQFMFRARMCRSLIFDRVEDWDQRTVHSCAKHKLITLPWSGYSFMLRSLNQTANQIRRSYKDDQSNIFVTDCLFRDVEV